MPWRAIRVSQAAERFSEGTAAPMSSSMGPLLMGAVIALMLAFDMQNLIARFKRALPLTEESSSDYTLVVPLYGDPQILTNLAFLSKYKANVLLVLNATNDAMIQFAQRMESEGWRVRRTNFLGKPRV